MSVILCSHILLKPLFSLVLEMFAEGLECHGTGIQARLQALPMLEK